METYEREKFNFIVERIISSANSRPLCTSRAVRSYVDFSGRKIVFTFIITSSFVPRQPIIFSNIFIIVFEGLIIMYLTLKKTIV